MTHAVCIVPVAPLRKFATHTAEMVSQLLFGEFCTVTETGKDGFVKIIVAADGYEGFCLLQHITAVPDFFNTTPMLLTGEWVNKLRYNNTDMYVPFGSSLPGYKDGAVVLGSYNFTAQTSCSTVSKQKTDSNQIQKIAFTFLNTTYLWGGRSVFGVDCSGFTQAVYKFFGIALLRDARQQATQGVAVDFLQQAQCGDLAFFDNDEGDIIHTGILLNNHEIIHASGKVQIDAIDNLGIVNSITGQRTQKLRIIKRYL